MSFTKKDLRKLQDHGLTIEEAERQIALLRNPPPPVFLVRPATVGDGIRRLTREDEERAKRRFEEVCEKSGISRFVPASGAASRMFQDFFFFHQKGENFSLEEVARSKEKGAQEVWNVLKNAEKIALFDHWNEACRRLYGKDYRALFGEGKAGALLAALVGEKGTGLARKPKGLLPFHRTGQRSRTPIEEHLLEAVETGFSGGMLAHFTVPSDFKADFQEKTEDFLALLRRERGVQGEVAFSVQSPSTDTLAIDSQGQVFRDEKGSILFRPGGHGALLSNLQCCGVQTALIKNIDNVVPDRLKPFVAEWNRILYGFLLNLRDKVFEGLRRLPHLRAGEEQEWVGFLERTFGRKVPPDPEAIEEALRRPIRVAGMVKRTGEPGGGPFWVKERSGGVSLQIVESAQIGDDPQMNRIFESSTHFNPVYLAASLTDETGKTFDLSRFVDEEAVFIARKSYQGRLLKTLERPGLWNGAMAGWNTVFVEIPLELFQPAKTLGDLLREGHQP